MIMSRNKIQIYFAMSVHRVLSISFERHPKSNIEVNYNIILSLNNQISLSLYLSLSLLTLSQGQTGGGGGLSMYTFLKK